MTLTAREMEPLESCFALEGYLKLPQVVPPEVLAGIREQILPEFARARQAGELFTGGGSVSGHLNCFPGQAARLVYEAVRDFGVIDLVRKLSPRPLGLPNVGCNLNLSGSKEQNIHVDGYASEPFMVINVAAVDTTLENGAMEACPGSHRRDHKYWEFVLAGYPRTRVTMATGDVIIRTSALWHRGMPNYSRQARPMLAFTWEDGGSKLEDPFMAHGGEIRFLPNRYATDRVGMLKEHAFATLPSLASGYRFVRSMLDG